MDAPFFVASAIATEPRDRREPGGNQVLVRKCVERGVAEHRHIGLFALEQTVAQRAHGIVNRNDLDAGRFGKLRRDTNHYLFDGAGRKYSELRCVHAPATEERSDGISCQQLQVMRGAGKPGAGNEYHVGETVGCRAADDGDQGFVQPDRQNAQGRHRRPADEVTESHQDQPGNQPRCRAFPEFREIRRVLEDPPDILCFGKTADDSVKHCRNYTEREPACQ